MAAVKNPVLKSLKWVFRIAKLCVNTLLSVIRLLIYSRTNTANPRLQEMKDRVFVLGNGPSLKQMIEKNIEFLSMQNVVAVNDFFLNNHFAALKPSVYVIADPAYWEPHATDEMMVLRQTMHTSFLNDVDWDMQFYIPAGIFKTGYFQKIFKPNSKIIIRPFNTTPFNGSKRMRFFFYDKLLARPYSGNVIGSALFIALQMDVADVYLFGVEHSWTRGLYVDEQNRTCLRNEHFYDNDQQPKVWLKSDAEPYKIHEALFDIAAMLGGYREMNDYSLHKGVNIHNCTPGSFIDAFRRKTWVEKGQACQ